MAFYIIRFKLFYFILLIHNTNSVLHYQRIITHFAQQLTIHQLNFVRTDWFTSIESNQLIKNLTIPWSILPMVHSPVTPDYPQSMNIMFCLTSLPPYFEIGPESNWLIFTTHVLSHKLLSIVQIPLNCLFVVATVISPKRVIFEQIIKSPYFKRRRIGEWNEKDGIFHIRVHPYEIHSKLGGMVINAAVVDSWPKSTFEPLFAKNMGNNRTVDGIMPRILWELEEVLNFTTNVTKVRSGYVGMESKSGEWTGATGLVIKGEIDIIVTDVLMQPGRRKVLTFPQPVFRSRYQVFLKDQNIDLYDSGRIFKPLHRYIWCGILVWVVVGSVLISVLSEIPAIKEHERKDHAELTYMNSVYFILQAICQQAYSHVPVSWSLRVIFLIAYLMSTIIISVYSGSLMSTLSQHRNYKAFDSLEEMAKSKHHYLCTGNNNGETMFFSMATDEFFKSIYDKFILPTILTYPDISSAPPDGRLKALCKHPEIAFFGDESSMRLTISKYQKSGDFDCEFSTFSKAVSSLYQSFAFELHSKFIKIFDYRLQRLRETGVIQRYTHQLLNIHAIIQSEIIVEVTMQKVGEIFICFFIGLVLSLIVLCAELIWFRFAQKNRTEGF